jgi:hypothetical protein
MEDESRRPQNRRVRQIWVDAMTEKKVPVQRLVLGCAAALAVAAAGWLCWHADAEVAWAAGQPMLSPAGAAGMIAHVLESETRPTRVIVLDPAQRVMAVYEVGRDKGEIKFLSSRNLSYDMQMLGYNSVDPSPEDIKKTLEMQ